MTDLFLKVLEMSVIMQCGDLSHFADQISHAQKVEEIHHDPLGCGGCKTAHPAKYRICLQHF